MKRFFNCIALRGIVVEIRKNESINGILNRIMRMSSRKYEEPIETNDESTERTRSGGSRKKNAKREINGRERVGEENQADGEMN